MCAESKILVVKLSSLGDLFHALPAVHAVKEHSGAEIHWVTQVEYVKLVEHFTPVDRVLAFPRRSWMSQGKYFLKELREHSYDAVLDFQGLLKSALVCRLAKTSQRIGPPGIREVPRSWYSTVASSSQKGVHAVDQSLEVARAFGASIEAVEFPVAFPGVSAPEGPGPLLGIAPCSRWSSKNWPESHFVQALQAIRAKMDCRIVLLGSRADVEVCARIEQALKGPVANMAGQSSIVELGGWVQALDCLITNDSGPMHMAVAAKVPMVALFGPTDPAKTGPYGCMGQVLRPPASSLEGISHRDYKHLDDQLIGQIPVEDVVSKALEFLQAAS